MKKGIIIGTLAFSLALGGGAYGYCNHVEAQKKEEIRVTNLKEAKKAVSSLYEKNNFKKGVTGKQILSAKKKVNNVTDNKDKEPLKLKVNQAQKLLDLQLALNGLIHNGTITNGVKPEQFDKAAKKTEAVYSFNKSFHKSSKDLLDKAKRQYNDIKTATKQVGELEKSPTENKYKSASATVAKIKNTSSKSDLTKRLDKVSNKLVAAKEEAKRKEAQWKAAEAVKSKATANSANSSTRPVPSNGSSQTPNSSSSSAGVSSGTSSGSKSSSSNQNKSTPSQNKSLTNETKSSSSQSKTTPSQNKSSSSTPNSNNNSSSNKGSSSNGSNAGGTDWNKVGKDLENKDWNHEDSGNVGSDNSEGQGNTWHSWN
ncbi:hypothetical protein AS888_05430 [Peribacillus simplex]|uniref:Pesticidal crystal protein Cry1Aa domain-containing protein n=1 Tax=Peribacillus simplex TaxID=1478 RepID=A0A109N1T7_9BACI|nr:toxin Cry1Ac domain D-VI-related protein [Peribacillus simplex]KWW21925.1 hypothetical protein AS888_05430 [Peribacillus simplex]